jgi:hypothetical protein
VTFASPQPNVEPCSIRNPALVAGFFVFRPDPCRPRSLPATIPAEHGHLKSGSARNRDEPAARLTVTVMSDTFLIAMGALIGAAAGAPLARFAAWRASRQPLAYDVDAERAVLRWVLDRPGRMVRLGQLTPEHFADSTHAALWQRLRELVGPLPVLAEDSSEDIIVAAEASVAFDPVTLRTIAQQFGYVPVAGPFTHDPMTAAQQVFELGDDRLRYPGASPIERGGPGEDPLVRRHRPAGRQRKAVAALLGAAAGAVTPSLAAQAWPQGTAFVFAVSALVVLSVGSIVWALVDQDTLLIDLETFFPLAGAAWLLTTLAAFAGGDPMRVAKGFGLSLALAIFFRLVNTIYGLYKLRTTGQRVDGMGGGDSWLVLATAGVPAALTGSLNVWYLCAMSGMVAAVLVWLLRWPTRWRIERTTPFAFGPYLALGWIIGGAAVAAGLTLW